MQLCDRIIQIVPEPRQAHSSTPTTRTAALMSCTVPHFFTLRRIMVSFLHTSQDHGVADWHAETGHQSHRWSPTRAVAE
jgi:hypothetical protein